MQRIALAPNGFGSAGDEMGFAVALSGDTAAVGAPWSNAAGGLYAGNVDVYRLQAGTWQPESALLPPHPDYYGAFGVVVALDGNVLVAGDSDTLYTFERDGTTWREVDEFLPSVGLPTNAAKQIGLSGNTLVSNGQVFVRSGSGWQLQTSLVPEGTERFTAMAIDGDFLVAASDSGELPPVAEPVATYFYSRTGVEWSLEGRVPNQPKNVSLSGRTALVAVDASFANDWVGRVLAFDRDDAGTWIETTLETVNRRSYLSAAISGDRAVVHSGNDYLTGMFVRSNGAWTRSQIGETYSSCFQSVALSDSMILVGCPDKYTQEAGIGTAEFYSLAHDPPRLVGLFGHGDASSGERFAAHVAVSGDLMIASSSTGVHFFEASTAGWTLTRMFPSTPTHTDAASVALHGLTAAVGYPLEVAGGTSEVVVYGRFGDTWYPETTITGSTAPGVVFGSALALQANTLVIGEQDTASLGGTCHVYEVSGSDWQAAPDLVPTGVAPDDRFCYSLSMSGSTLIVGAPATDIGTDADAGAVYVFEHTGSSWTQQGRLVAPVTGVGARFGSSVAIRGDTVVVGSNDSDVPSASTYGEVNVYRRVANAWTWQATLDPPADAPGDFGFAVAVSDTEDRIGVTAPYDLVHDSYHGVAYAYAFDGVHWLPALTVRARPSVPPVAQDGFGWNVAFVGNEFVIGAPNDGDGAVYVGAASERIFADGFEASP